MKIEFDPQLTAAAPGLRVLYLEAEVSNGETGDELWTEIEAEAASIRTTYRMEDIRHRPSIDATRSAYKALGKEPNRYRPSAEALSRRAVKGLELYRTLAVIDLVNLVSLHTGVSIGAFDLDKIQGDTLTLGVGHEGEPYEAIGRGQLNIAGLPVFRDAVGGIGTPTSDNDRTKLSPSTRRVCMTVNLYSPEEPQPAEILSQITSLLRRHAAGTVTFAQVYPAS